MNQGDLTLIPAVITIIFSRHFTFIKLNTELLKHLSLFSKCPFLICGGTRISQRGTKPNDGMQTYYFAQFPPPTPKKMYEKKQIGSRSGHASLEPFPLSPLPRSNPLMSYPLDNLFWILRVKAPFVNQSPLFWDQQTKLSGDY